MEAVKTRVDRNIAFLHFFFDINIFEQLLVHPEQSIDADDQCDDGITKINT